MDRFRYNQCSSEVHGHVTFGASRGDCISEDLAAGAAEPPRRFVLPFLFHFAKGEQQFRGRNGADWPLANGLVDEADQPPFLLHGDGGATLFFDLREIFLRHSLEAACGRDTSGNALKFRLLARVVSAGEHLARSVALLACICEADRRPPSKRKRLLLAKVAVVHPPAAGARRRDFQIKSVAIGKLVRLITTLCSFDRHR
jgi:hypothetical protein